MSLCVFAVSQYPSLIQVPFKMIKVGAAVFSHGRLTAKLQHSFPANPPVKFKKLIKVKMLLTTLKVIH